MGDRSPKSKQRDKNQKAAAKAKARGAAAKRQASFTVGAEKPSKK
ncbi:MAG: hypothetical protein R3B13_08385 [Polyangiaceae bacterium]